MLCYVMLCYVMLCYVMLCYVMLCYVMLCYVMLEKVDVYIFMLAIWKCRYFDSRQCAIISYQRYTIWYWPLSLGSTKLAAAKLLYSKRLKLRRRVQSPVFCIPSCYQLIIEMSFPKMVLFGFWCLYSGKSQANEGINNFFDNSTGITAHAYGWPAWLMKKSPNMYICSPIHFTSKINEWP
jgi:hypothetical protein